MEKTFSLTRRDDGIALLTMDVPGETMNTLKAQFAPEITAILQEIKADSSIKGLVLVSGKPDSFVAGADISMLDACKTAEDARLLSRQGHHVFAELEGLNIPVVAAIHGVCLGGGLELALACHQRVCSDSSKTMLGVPEVQLGLLPGGGGTQRLPRLVGIATALDMMLTGKQVRPKQAIKMGLVDDVVPQSILLETAIKMAAAGKKSRAPKKTSLVTKLLEGTGVGRNIMFDQAEKQVMKKTQGNYPAPLKIIDCVREGMAKGMEKGLEVEAAHFGALVATPQSAALRSIFFATTEMKKETGAGDVAPRAVKKAMVLGGGLMGGGIASVTTTKAKVPVRVKDISEKGLSNALGYAYKLLDKGVKRRHMTPAERDKLMALMTTTTDYRGVKDADIVVEAVFEDLNLKHQMVRDVERECAEHTIFASNTSSLPITQIAAAAARPENVIGLHYFSPVEKMPLVEVIAHDKTSPETIATTVAFARKQGKTPIVVKDCAGFYVNRILALYMNEAAQLLLEGQSVEHLDKSLVKFGFPVGPMTLLDEVGIDVGAKISPILEKELGERFKAPAAFDKLMADERKGRKNGKGFYLYGKAAGKTKKVDESVYGVLGLVPGTAKEAGEIAERCIVQMLNEAVRCLEEGIIASPRDGDIGAIFGIGFPPFLGGPFRYMDTMGAAKLVGLLEGYQRRFGDRFTPAPLLKSMAAEGKSFY
ncbi:fatty acid oxidation complex subunit alpha FadJ [Shewanella sp. JM162201]|uniref:Fatty acid oxidation complex subunit alpha n=1 Tax=Shewanella jiangmenensis TaxID=2837387 RepID=A0ABS5VBA2_9GAMM|nr:fatty acid oxidation complex subunit alpha FadJ [Shewanella jiangmenensis]MBT1446323.1 fatty acid oxidation complex subunit alpha FadJ [Shewanella jiangmenensis]